MQKSYPAPDPPPDLTPGLSGTRRMQARILEAESRETPRAFMAVLRTLRRDPSAAGLIAENETRQFLARVWWPQSFVRQDFGPDVTLFRGRKHPGGRRLLVAVTALWGRMTIPTPVFLQSVLARDWDVLLLRDGARTHYRRGCAGYADSFPALVERVAGLASGYAGCCAMGTSMGGLTAIRLALQIPGARGVSVGGRAAADIARLFQDRFAGLAFDPLCACLPEASRDLVFLHGGDNVHDRRVARQFAEITGGQRIGLRDMKAHAILADFWRQGTLKPALAALMDQRLTGGRLARSLAGIVG